jgi:hypothetical protein
MRTTIDIDDDALEAARQLAFHREQSLGSVVSELILKGLQSDRRTTRRSGFPVFHAPAGAKPISLDDVRQAEDEA